MRGPAGGFIATSAQSTSPPPDMRDYLLAGMQQRHVDAIPGGWIPDPAPSPLPFQWLSYSSWRRSQSWNPSSSSRPFGARSRIG
jgi:hypothetical protein